MRKDVDRVLAYQSSIEAAVKLFVLSNAHEKATVEKINAMSKYVVSTMVTWWGETDREVNGEAVAISN